MFQTQVVQKITTSILLNNLFFENHAVYEITLKNIVDTDRPQITIWRMRIACWIPEATNTQSVYATIIAFPLQQWLPERSSVLVYTYIACSVNFLLRFHLVSQNEQTEQSAKNMLSDTCSLNV
jgi:hypothetical protein